MLTASTTLGSRWLVPLERSIMQLQETMIKVIDNLVFRPLVWALAWKPGSDKNRAAWHYYWEDDDDQ